eukprot:TRINITY_DN2398_c0_g1_i2.p1 TRINITY_DN2398_c0_g1~~TRINITY_DN2398_c0_g1_i2.p1  ORF type:complete len:415 (-),score=112.21 TRINITY_DN2398_c0_g1_i2:928-2172(-)
MPGAAGVIARQTGDTLRAGTALCKYLWRLEETNQVVVAKVDAICSKYLSKYLSRYGEGSLRTSVETMIKVVDSVTKMHSGLIEELLVTAKEIEQFVASKEAAQRKLVEDAVRVQRDMDLQVEAVHKAQKTFDKAFKETVEARSVFMLRKNDPNIKFNTVTHLEQKMIAAQANSKQLNTQLGEIIAAANAKLDSLYNVDQKQVLDEFRRFQDDYVMVLKDKCGVFASKFVSTPMSELWQRLGVLLTTSAQDITPSADTELFFANHSAELGPPTPFVHQPCVDICMNVVLPSHTSLPVPARSASPPAAAAASSDKPLAPEDGEAAATSGPHESPLCSSEVDTEAQSSGEEEAGSGERKRAHTDDQPQRCKGWHLAVRTQQRDTALPASLVIANVRPATPATATTPAESTSLSPPPT